MPASKATEPVTRNAIGVPVDRHDIDRHDNVPGAKSVPNGAQPAGSGSAAAAGPAKVDAALEHRDSPQLPGSPQLKVSPPVSPTIVNRGSINGTAFTRPGSGQSAIGGSAKTATGISGSTIRPKH
jgi:hypothetical protein